MQENFAMSKLHSDIANGRAHSNMYNGRARKLTPTIQIILFNVRAFARSNLRMVLSKIFEQLEFLLSEAEHSCNIVLKTYHRNCLRAHTVRPYGVDKRVFWCYDMYTL